MLTNYPTNVNYRVISEVNSEHHSDRRLPSRRSNKPLTQFACSILEDFIEDSLDPGNWQSGNTSVSCKKINGQKSLIVCLYETKLLDLVYDRNDKVIHLCLSIGNRFDPGGAPSRAVVERLNGILDTLGRFGILPEDTRFFKDREENVYYFGRNDERVAVGQNYARNIILESSAYCLNIEYTDIDVNKSVKVVPVDKKIYRHTSYA
jgi:hypothetical protein